LAQNPSVNIFSAGKNMKGIARVKRVTGLKDPLLGIFTRKYGNNEVRKRYWGQEHYVEIEITSQSSPSDYRELYYADLETAFDGVAEHYDDHILGNQMNLWLRNRSVNLLTKLFRPGEIVLEIGCGSGTETLQLARNGTRVIASDISSKMLGVLVRKAREMGLEQQIIPLHARPYMLKEKLRELGYASIDGAYSTYGAINTEPNMEPLVENLHSLIKPRGKLLLGVWNKYCLYEMVGYSIRMRPTMTVARLRNPVPVGKSRFCVASMAYSVGSLSRMISSFFKLEKVYGVEILLPPSNLTEYLPPERILNLVKRLEVNIESHYPWNRLGDHFLGVYSRVE
jgi:SAM-dependent methyltransferase